MTLVWRKSSRSNNQEDADCVEIALNGSKALVRDTKNRTGFVIQSGNWEAFIGAVKRGDLENN
ncbi:DUF397 domain-containing protein [Lentzea sp. NPDC051838]|uniref:DUF397 domain-containing protein n=1 Tax=Lentzea sp. NPDC051838 TaxID=3154849 RepID=UPI00343656F6